jgi:acetyl-CoA C-acetyltransferase
MGDVFVVAAELSGKLTARPEAPLGQMMSEAAWRALRSARVEPEAVDAIFTGAMGSFEPEGFVGRIPIQLANGLDLRKADVAPMMVGSSEVGAWVLRQAFQSCRWRPEYRHVLVVGGEQMNPLAGQRATPPALRLAERVARTRAIGEILDERERHYGLNMVRMGDLLMEALAHGEGWSTGDVTDVILPLIAMTKYERIAGYRLGHFHGRVEPNLGEYRGRSRITRYFNLHDVTPTSSGAVALLLAREPVGDALEIVGMGQGLVPISLTSRPGDMRRSGSVRAAIHGACTDAGVGTDWLLDADFAVIHDAFPSIEYAILKELGLRPSQIVERATSGWGNPFGGLKACGHALGASGLLQIAKSHQRIFLNPTYLTEAAIAGSQPAERCWTCSVGGPLTNVVVSLLRRHGAPGRQSATQRPTFDPRDEPIEPSYQALREQIPPGSGLVVTRSRLVHTPAFGDDDVPLFRAHRDPWIYLVERPPSDGDRPPKCYAYAEVELPLGAVCELHPETIEGESYLRAGAARGVLDLRFGGETAEQQADRVTALGDLRRRLARYEP